MKIKVSIDNSNEIIFNSIEEAINALYELKKKQILSKPSVSRCHKCVYENSCPNIDIDGSCSVFKRDPPDGGYYG